MPAKRYAYDYPRPMVTVDAVLFRLIEGDLQTLLVRRRKPPHKGKWALPGGFIKMKEPLEESVIREVGEETGVEDIALLMQLGTYGDPGRDPRGRVISVAYVGIVTDTAEATAGDDAAEAKWMPVECLPERPAFDHERILSDGMSRIVAAGRNSGVLFAFLPETFTEKQLQTVLDAVYEEGVPARDYVRYFVDQGLVERARGGKRYRFRIGTAG